MPHTVSQVFPDKKRIALGGVLTFFICFGFASEFDLYYFDDSSAYLGIVGAAAAFLLYLIPLLFACLYLARTSEVKPSIIIVGLLVGAFACGTLAAWGNDSVGALLIDSPLADFGLESSLVPAIVEELLKVGGALAVVYILFPLSPMAALVAGFAVGLGFQYTEDLSYIALSIDPDVAPDNVLTLVANTTVARLQGALSSHWLMTATLTGGVACIAYALHNGSRISRPLIVATVAPIVLHATWNALADIEDSSLLFFQALISLALFASFFFVLHQARQSDTVPHKTPTA